ncbi:ribonuclease H-like domain-containing protein [Mycena galopus ATCC 62051]|nr:ribonuclease H-like domain-containing protein [Mycena galopus ATCC 62051]
MPELGPLWTHFHCSDNKPNGIHHPLAAALADKVDVLGEKKAMAGHLRKCPHATQAERDLAATHVPTEADKKSKRKVASDTPGDVDDESAQRGEQSGERKKRKLVAAVETSIRQSSIAAYACKGIDLPFTADQRSDIADQFLRATQSANLPERWVEDPEVMKLFVMFRSQALDVMPSRRQLSGPLLKRASARVDAEITDIVKGEDVLLCTDGWRSVTKDNVGGVHLNSLLIDVLRTNSWRKDGELLAVKFGNMIDKAETSLGCNVVAFLTDNDGGSKKGRNLLAAARPWLIVFPCCAHQGQLILGEYLRENEKASELTEELIDFVHWLNSHDKVRDIFDGYQAQLNEHGTVLAYDPIRRSILLERDAIIKAQVGAETNRARKESLRNNVLSHCISVEENGWWDRLDAIIVDFEHICFLTNIAQSDHVRPDQFCLALAGLYLHFAQHSDSGLGARMCKRLEKRWAELDQPVFLIAEVLNPFEKLSRFGDKANIDVFILALEVVNLFLRINSRPLKTPRSPEKQTEHEQQLQERSHTVSTTFMQYVGGTGPFANWNVPNSQAKASYIQLNGDDPIPYWEFLAMNAQVSELAKFAITLLRLVANQAGLERTFSDFLNKKNKKRARLGLEKMAMQSKVTRRIREDHYTEGLRQKRQGRKNHSEAQVKTLLSVPRYSEAGVSDTDDENNGIREKQSVLIKSKAAWRKQVQEWQQEMHDLSDDEEVPTAASGGRRQWSWLPASLKILFGGQVTNPVRLVRRKNAYTEETLHMELLAAECSDEEPDAGAEEGSGDDYEG